MTGITSAMSAATSGLMAQSKALGSISSNIANSSTTGFKATTTDFASYINKTSSIDEQTGGVLATQSLSGSVTNNERGYLDAEFQQLQDEVDGITKGTRFNDQSLLDGTTQWNTGGVSFRVGTESTDNITVTIANVTTTGLGINTLDVSTSATAAAALTSLDTAVTSLSTARANVGALISRFEFRGEVLSTSIENTSAAQSAIMDVDVATEQSKLASEKVLTQAAIAALSQANQMPENLLSLLR